MGERGRKGSMGPPPPCRAGSAGPQDAEVDGWQIGGRWRMEASSRA